MYIYIFVYIKIYKYSRLMQYDNSNNSMQYVRCDIYLHIYIYIYIYIHYIKHVCYISSVGPSVCWSGCVGWTSHQLTAAWTVIRVLKTSSLVSRCLRIRTTTWSVQHHLRPSETGTTRQRHVKHTSTRCQGQCRGCDLRFINIVLLQCDFF